MGVIVVPCGGQQCWSPLRRTCRPTALLGRNDAANDFSKDVVNEEQWWQDEQLWREEQQWREEQRWREEQEWREQEFREEGRQLRVAQQEADKTQKALTSLARIGVPAVLCAVFGFLYFDEVSLALGAALDEDTRAIISSDDDSGQFVQNFLIVIDLLFAILAGNAYTALYKQQEALYFAIYQEVSVARSLLEQLTLVGLGRTWYGSSLVCLQRYITHDLRRLDISPVKQLSERPIDDPLEAIMYMTSVGVPSNLYETVKELHQARGIRLGAFQSKFPRVGITLLYLLAILELGSFPLLGAGTANLSELPDAPSVSILELQAFVFACLCGSLVLVLRIIEELWQTRRGGLFNVDDVLQEISLGLEEELDLRIRGLTTPQ